MTERPILFSAPMVSAILAGRKTQTRRIITPQPRVVHGFSGGYLKTNQIFRNGAAGLRVPFGQPGDHLWVKETWRTGSALAHCKPSDLAKGAAIQYEADKRTNINNHEEGAPHYGWGRIRQSIFMRRWMSRITLEVTAIRVQRLQDITPADALAEGLAHGFTLNDNPGFGLPEWHQELYRISPIDAYQLLWESIHGPGSWQENPYVWVVEFNRLTP